MGRNPMISYNFDLITNLSSEIGSYWYGWTFGRAYIDPNRNRVKYSVPFKDIGHLYLLLKDLHANTSPRIITKNINGIKYKGAYININSKKLKDFYLNLFEQFNMNNNLGNLVDKRHFLRGLFDAHGIFTKNRGYLRIGYNCRYYNVVQNLISEIIYSLIYFSTC